MADTKKRGRKPSSKTPPAPAPSPLPVQSAQVAQAPREKPFALPVNAAFLKNALRFMAELPEILLPGGSSSRSPHHADTPQAMTDAGVNAALAGIGNLLGVSRAYLMLDEAEGRYLRNTHEWVDGTIGPAMHSWPLHDYEKDLPSLKGLMAGTDFYAAHTRDTPPDLHRVLTMQAVDSVLLVPLTQNGAWIGLMGFDVCGKEREWREEEIALLRHLARLAAVALERRGYLEARARLARVRAALEMDDEAPRRKAAPPLPENPQSLRAAERAMIEETLNLYHGNRLRTAKHLGLTWAQLDRRCKKLGIAVKKEK